MAQLSNFLAAGVISDWIKYRARSSYYRTCEKHRGSDHSRCVISRTFTGFSGVCFNIYKKEEGTRDCTVSEVARSKRHVVCAQNL